jgi:hypothetical protein
MYVNRKSLDFIGGAERDRTVDLLNAIQALSQLSYSPTLGRQFSKANALVGVNRGSCRVARRVGAGQDGAEGKTQGAVKESQAGSLCHG